MKITKAKGRHSHVCRPSTQKFVQHHKKADTFSIYTRHTASNATKSKAINTLIEMMRYKDHVKSRTIRSLLMGVVPPGVPIESALIVNVCARSKVIISGIDQDNFGVERLVGITTEATATLLDESTSDYLNEKKCAVDLKNPEFVGSHTKHLHTMLLEALAKKMMI